VIKVFESHRGTSYAGMSLKEAAVRESAGACPNCGAGLHYIKGAYTCSTNKSQKQPDGTWQQVSGCGFKMWESVAQKKLTKPVIQELLGKGVTAKKVKGLKSKSGKAYEAVLALDKATGRISPVF
jgi:DNA topoisomerase-3